MQKYLALIAMFAMACLPVACSKPGEAVKTPAGEAVVQWPNLRALDELAEQAEAGVAEGELEGLRKLGSEIKPAAARVAADPLPQGASQPDQVLLLQQDLQALTQSLNAPESMPEAELRETLQGVHPIVEKLMEAAGVPHVHEHDHEHSGEEPAHDHAH